MPKLLVSAEVNLDYPFLEHRPQARAVRRDDLFRAFSQVIEAGVRERADFFVVAGNLFHDNPPANDTLSFVVSKLDELTRLSPRTQVVMIPGDREKGQGGSALKVLKFIDHVNVLDAQDSPVLNFNTPAGPVTMVCVQARGGVTPKALPAVTRGFGALLCHDTYQQFFQAHPEDTRRRKEVLLALRERGYGLVVLGKGHRPAAYSLDDLPCLLPGSMEHLCLKEERPYARSVTVVEAGPQGASARLVPLATREIINHEVLFQLGQETPRRLLEPLLKGLDHEKVLRLELQGEMRFKDFRDMRLDHFVEKATERCLDVVLNNNLFLVDDDYAHSGPDVAVIRPKMEFVHTLHDLMEQAKDKEGKNSPRAKLLARVLELGVKEFDGDS